MAEIKPRVGPICKNVLSDDFYLKILKVSLNLFVSQIATAVSGLRRKESVYSIIHMVLLNTNVNKC